MTSSELHKPDTWKANPLLQTKSAAPSFLRLNWDDAQVADFGPWRIINNDAPLISTSLESADLQDIELLPEAHAVSVDADGQSEVQATAGVQVGIDPQTLETIKAAAYAEGMAAGIAAGKQETEKALAADQLRDHALLMNVVSALQNLASDQEQMFEPLKRLALHMAEQLVRAELKLSGSAIEQLVRQCLAQLDQPADKAVVCLNPHDLDRFVRFTEGAHGLRLEADARLQEGSVRVEVNDSLVEDLIEHRLEALSRQLLGDAHARLESTRFETGGLKTKDAESSNWPSSSADDVTDLPYRETDEGDRPAASAPRAEE